MHETRTMSRDRERDLKIWPRDHVGLENLTSLFRTNPKHKPTVHQRHRRTDGRLTIAILRFALRALPGKAV